jgi:hypothetical protein
MVSITEYSKSATDAPLLFLGGNQLGIQLVKVGVGGFFFEGSFLVEMS